MQCPTCGEKHDLTAMEPAFRFPDAYIALPASEREVKASIAPGGDACVVFTIPDAPPTGYLRAVLPVPIRGDGRLCNWGVWIELAQADMLRVADRWDVSDQSKDAPIPGSLANDIPEYRPTLGLTGVLRLKSQTARPQFYLDPHHDHPLARAQRDGVVLEQAVEWVLARLHSASRPAL